MDFIREVVRKVYHYNRYKDWDTLHIVAGDEGKGKSNLMLHLIDNYLQHLKGEVTEQDIGCVAQDHEQFEEVIKNLKKYGCAADDEAGDITTKRAMSSLNVRISNKYKVIRGKNGYSVLLTPTLFDMESYFLKHRCKGLFFVYRRGRVAFWTRESVKKILALNQGRYIKSPWVVKADFLDKFSIYKGPLKEPYNKQKEEGMRKKQQESENEEKRSVREIEKEKLIELVAYAASKGYTSTELSHIFGCTTRSIQRYLKEYRDKRQELNNMVNSDTEEEASEECN